MGTQEETPPRLFAVVVNWNRPDDTLECLRSLDAQEGIDLRLVVVDNDSSDDSVARIRAAFPRAELIESPENLRFGGGYNLGIRRALEAGADYIFLINNDAYVSPDTLSRLLEHAREADVGLVAPLIYYADPADRIWSIGGTSRPWLLEVAGDARGQVDPGRWPPSLERDFVTGCCFLAPRRTFELVGLFDERFILYYEDADFCQRVREAGLRILVAPSAKAWHKVALSSGGRDAPDERYWMARSSVTFFRKHARPWQVPMIFTYRLGSALKTSLRLSLAGQFASLRAYWRGLRAGLRGDPAP